MNRNTHHTLSWQLVPACAIAAIALVGCEADRPTGSSELVQFGGMHEAIGSRQHHGRVSVSEITGRPHFYGVGALEALKGEITVLDSVAIMTGVTEDGRPRSMTDLGVKATLLVGQSIGSWTDVVAGEEVSHERFDETVGTLAAKAGLDISKPFIFVIEGEFRDVRYHVINGACPIHARMKQVAIDDESRPLEVDADRVTGTLVGVYAADSVGKLTHPATSTHVHLISIDDGTGERITGHVERVGLAKGVVLRLPRSREGDRARGAEPSRR
jgi:alpha-acetolactate decarboxylase